MKDSNYSVAEYVEDLRRITAEETDEKAIFRAASAASKAADFVLSGGEVRP